MMTNLTKHYEDTRVMLNRSLTFVEDNTGRLDVLVKRDSDLIESIYNRQIIRGICDSQKHHTFSNFLTYTGNRKTYFGMKPIK